MFINIDYGKDYDVLYIPDGDYDPVELHQSFIKWIYDNHKFVVTLENGESIYDYDATAFVEWLNEYIFKDGEKARIAVKFAGTIDESNVTIGF